ncbi:MAG TPA: NAD(+) diphosphatase [Kofleriaceae bacterium]
MVFVPGVVPPEASSPARLFVLDGQSLFVSDEPAVPLGAPAPDDLYLGALDGVPCFARAEPPPPDTRAVPLRQLFGVLPDADFAVALRALGTLAWDRDHRHCGRDGTPTVRSQTERTRLCPLCGLSSYPRISPAVIMLVERDGRALLARNARFPVAFHSCLAGFVELGETLEECVAREVREEVGIAIADIRYFGSQSWPFSNSLMVGFTARYASGDIAFGDGEIAEAAWYPPDALPRIPPSGLSISRALIDDFVRRHGTL